MLDFFLVHGFALEGKSIFSISWITLYQAKVRSWEDFGISSFGKTAFCRFFNGEIEVNHNYSTNLNEICVQNPPSIERRFTQNLSPMEHWMTHLVL